ncbi:MAG: Uma2 family endonuclease [Acidobacteria bacterium]|nr:Uma2 family endonuclease [Acidobacteriota bacterium]
MLSASTESADRGRKLQAYRAIETLQEYVLVSQSQPQITHYIKQENGEWQSFDIAGLTAAISLNSINCSLLLSDIYEGIRFD